MKEAKTGICRKCGKFFYIHSHHIFPKAIFGDGKTIDLCPCCHTHFHEYSKKHIVNPHDKKEAARIWYTWVRTVSVIIGAVALIVVLGFLW